MPRIPGLLERIQQPLYDTLIVEPNKREYMFFQEPYTTSAGIKLLDFDGLMDASKAEALCPLCREELIKDFTLVTASVIAAIHQCKACSTYYHRNCANEFSGCSTMGCSEKGKKIPPPINKSKTLFETNMVNPGSLPYPQNFEIHVVTVEFDKTADQYEVDLFKDHSLYTLHIGTKDYLNIPLATLCNVTNASRAGGYVLSEPIDLIPQMHFYAKVEFYGPKKGNSSFQMRSVLHGFFKREVH